MSFTLNSRALVRQRGGYRTGNLIRVSSQQSVPEQTDPRPGQLQPQHPAVSIIPKAFLSSGVQGRSPSASFVDVGPSTTSERLQQHTYEELEEDPFPTGAGLKGGSGITTLSLSSKTSGKISSPSGKGGCFCIISTKCSGGCKFRPHLSGSSLCPACVMCSHIREKLPEVNPFGPW